MWTFLLFILEKHFGILTKFFMDPNHKHIKFSIKKVVLLQPEDEECERLVTDENDLFFSLPNDSIYQPFLKLL